MCGMIDNGKITSNLGSASPTRKPHHLKSRENANRVSLYQNILSLHVHRVWQQTRVVDSRQCADWQSDFGAEHVSVSSNKTGRE